MRQLRGGRQLSSPRRGGGQSFIFVVGLFTLPLIRAETTHLGQKRFHAVTAGEAQNVTQILKGTVHLKNHTSMFPPTWCFVYLLVWVKVKVLTAYVGISCQKEDVLIYYIFFNCIFLCDSNLFRLCLYGF